MDSTEIMIHSRGVLADSGPVTSTLFPRCSEAKGARGSPILMKCLSSQVFSHIAAQ